MPKKRIWRRKVKAEIFPYADGKSWGWSIMTGAFYMESGIRQNLKTEEEARNHAKWVCENMGLTVIDWHTLKN